MSFSFSPLLGILGAAILGGIVGIQRQAAAKPAGFRTHLLVAAASAAFTAMGAYLHDTRIPSYIVVGIGFLGGGAIVRDGANTRGLTTAATIWVVSAIGLLMGYANAFSLEAAILLTAITIGALVIADSDLLRLVRIPRKATLHVTCEAPHETTEAIAWLLRDAKIRYDTADVANITSEGGKQVAQLEYLLSVGRGDDMNALLTAVIDLPGVRRVEVNEPFFMT